MITMIHYPNGSTIIALDGTQSGYEAERKEDKDILDMHIQIRDVLFMLAKTI